MSLKDLGYKPRSATRRIVMDDSLRQAVESAQQALVAAKRLEARDDQGLGSKIPDLERALADAEAAADEAAVSFTCQALPRHQMEALVDSSPPTSEELATWKEQAQSSMLMATQAPTWSVKTFPPKLIGHSLVEPETTPEEVQDMWSSGAWSTAVWDQLWDLAWKVNQEVSTRPTYGTVSKPTADSGPESSTPSNMESPIPLTQVG